MSMPVTSRHLIGASELTLIADIKPGLVEVAEPTAYSTSLRLWLETFFDFGSAAIEREGLIGLAGPLELLRSLQRIHWSIHDNDSKLLLAVSFDGPWEPYIRDIVEKAGPLLDIIFCHCSGYAPGHTCFEGYPQFSQWVRDRQQRCEFFFAGSPDITGDAARYLQQFQRAHSRLGAVSSFDTVAAGLTGTEPPRAP